VGLMNQAPAEENSKPHRANKHLQNTAVGLMNQAPTKRELSFFRLKKQPVPFFTIDYFLADYFFYVFYLEGLLDIA
jgi:hypothetical protein